MSSKVTPGSDDFDWMLFLQQDLQTVPSEHFQKARELAKDWPTCACGQLCKKLPRDWQGKPEDSVLSDLGGLFYGRICSLYGSHYNSNVGMESKRQEALAIFELIEVRAAQLLQQQA